MTRKALVEMADKVGELRSSIEKESFNDDTVRYAVEELESIMWLLAAEQDRYSRSISLIMSEIFAINNLLLQSGEIKMLIKPNRKDFLIKRVTIIENIILDEVSGRDNL